MFYAINKYNMLHNRIRISFMLYNIRRFAFRDRREPRRDPTERMSSARFACA